MDRILQKMDVTLPTMGTDADRSHSRRNHQPIFTKNQHDLDVAFYTNLSLGFKEEKPRHPLS
jgi:hypothetical protein